jgi:hypothetical protein
MTGEDRQRYLREVTTGMEDARARFQEAHRAFEDFEKTNDSADGTALKDRIGDLLGSLHEIERLTHLLEEHLHDELAPPTAAPSTGAAEAAPR